MGNKDYRFLIFGTGALGSVFGAFLKRIGIDVVFYGRGMHFKKICENGLKITGIWGEFFIDNPPTIRTPKDLELFRKNFDAVLLCVKSYQTLDALEQVASLLKDNGLLISIQNGLGNVEKIAQYVGKERTIGGRVIFGANIPEPGVAEVTVYADKVLLGNPFIDLNLWKDGNSQLYEILQFLIDSLNKAGIPTDLVDKNFILSKIWEKVLYNAALNPLGALFGVSYGELHDNPYTFELIRNILKEAYALISFKKVPFAFGSFEEYFKFFIEKQVPPTRKHHASMLQDIQNGKKTEIDALNGALVKYAEELSLDMPYNRIITEMVHAKESFKLIDKKG